MDPLTPLPPTTWSSGPTLADLAPSVASGLGFGDSPALPVPTSHTVVVLMVDGLGDLLLQEHSAIAPTLSAHRALDLRAGFPSTTATSLTSLGTGLPAGEHGVLGYSFAPRDLDPAARHTLNALRWTLDAADGPDARALFPPLDVQPLPTAFDGLAQAGVDVIAVMPSAFRGSGLTAAAYGDPADYRDASSIEAVGQRLRAVLAAGDQGPRMVYAYVPDVDAAGHVWGPGTPEWQARLRGVDDMVATVIAALPPGATLLVTGDHGMITAGERIDLDTAPDLTDGAAAIAGEARVRHVYAKPGAAERLLTTWQEALGRHAHVVGREQVLDEQWFGPRVAAHAVERIGDVVAVPHRDTVLIRSLGERFESTMPGHHGGWTAAELLVPLIVATGTA